MNLSMSLCFSCYVTGFLFKDEERKLSLLEKSVYGSVEDAVFPIEEEKCWKRSQVFSRSLSKTQFASFQVFLLYQRLSLKRLKFLVLYRATTPLRMNLSEKNKAVDNKKWKLLSI